MKIEFEHVNEKIFKKGFNQAVQITFAVILLFLMISMLNGAFKLFTHLGFLWQQEEITGNYLNIISDVLTLFILVELSRSLIDFFETHRFRITFLVDATIVFIIREVMIQLFQHKVSENMLYALSAFLLVLTILRLGTTYVHQFVTPESPKQANFNGDS